MELPLSFSWRNKGDARKSGRPSRVYACDAINQHEMSWCGVCYIVSALQVIQDRAYIINPNKHIAVSLQSVINQFQVWNAHDSWNICLGGSVSRVVQCFQEKTCPLVVEDKPRFIGFAKRTTRCDVSNAPFVVSDTYRIPTEKVKAEIFSSGPVVLEISHITCKSTDDKGIARDDHTHPLDHCVSVVGWTVTTEGIEYWIVRNSWGKERVPKTLPENLSTCVSVDFNLCKTEWEKWKSLPSDPGFFLLPTNHPALYSFPYPWIVVRVDYLEK